ncbi:MAG: hypothetical protein HQL56_19135, partial [Magnetococcales bacterium]|nr:hypothetical protein [Magnetococcales bacterium]
METSIFDTSSTSLAPSMRLFLLEAHREKPVLPWLDRLGHRLAARFKRWFSRPVAQLRRRAKSVLREATPLFDVEEQTLQEHLRQAADQARIAGPGNRKVMDATLTAAVAAVKRVTGLTPHPEQVMGALALLACHVAEMATGEGKTLTAAMAAVAAAWQGWPCQVVTANDYLAKRDAELFAKLFDYCNLSVAHIDGETPPDRRGAAYNHDVVYTTAKELLGDYLRDRLALGKSPSRTRVALSELGALTESRRGEVVMRGLYQVIVDEADSVLIDEAVTPLIISMPRPDASMEQAALDAVTLAKALEE